MCIRDRSRIAQVDDGHIVAVAVLCNRTVISSQVTLAVQRQPAHTGGAGIFQIGVQEKCGLANTAGTDHEAVNVIAVHQCGELLRLPLATEDQSLLRGEILSFALLSDLEGHMGIGLPDFLVGGPSGCTMLPIAHSAGFDIAKGIVMGHHGQPARCV